MPSIDKESILKRIDFYYDDSFLKRVYRKLSYFHKQLYIKYLKKAARAKKLKTSIITGQKMSIILPDNISSSLYLIGLFEGSETKAFIEIIKPDSTFYDIGAHIGYYSVLAAHLGGSSMNIISVEPTPSTFSILKENMAGIQGSILFNIGLYSKPGELELNDYGIEHMCLNGFKKARLKENIASNKLKVSVHTLDDIVNRTGLIPDVVKIDAESVELDILNGAKETLSKNNPIIFLEVGDFENIDIKSSSKIINYLKTFGYFPFEYKNEFIPHEIRDLPYPSMSLYFFKS